MNSGRGSGHWLRLTRLALGLTEAEAAADFGVTPRTYRRYEARGLPKTKWRRQVEFCVRHDVDVAWLLTGDSSFLGLRLNRRPGVRIAILPVERSEDRNRRLAGAIWEQLPRNTRDALDVLDQARNFVERLSLVRRGPSNIMPFPPRRAS